MKQKIFLTLLLMISWFMSAGSQYQEDFTRAEDAYKQQDYHESARVYQGLLDKGYRSFELFYNLGCAYFKMGEPGMSRAFFIIADMYKPRNHDNRHNLEIVEASLKDRFEGGGGFFLSDLYAGLVRSFTYRTWNILFYSLICMFLAFFSAYFLFLNLRLRAVGIAAVILLITLILVFPFYRSSSRFYHEPGLGVIINESTPVRNGPDSSMVSLTSLNDGTLVRISEKRGDFYRVILPNGIVGWIEGDRMFLITAEYFK